MGPPTRPQLIQTILTLQWSGVFRLSSLRRLVRCPTTFLRDDQEKSSVVKFYGLLPKR